ncbi:MAG: hypothetical protein ACRD3N_11475 [Terracidiphilus sp.]
MSIFGTTEVVPWLQSDASTEFFRSLFSPAEFFRFTAIALTETTPSAGTILIFI